MAVAPAWKWVLGITYVEAGREGESRKILAELEAEPPGPWRAYGLGNLYSALGEKDKAFESYAYEPRHAFLPWVTVGVGAETAPLRHDPRFQDLLQRFKLPR